MRRRTHIAAWTAVACAAFGITALPAAEDRLPDLILRPELLYRTEIDRQTQPGRELLRLTVGSANVGSGPLELRGSAILSPTQREVVQRIYRSDGTWFDRLAGAFTYHPDHGHVHFDAWTVFRLRELPEAGGIGGVVAQGSKVSFCLLDGAVYDPANPFFAPYEVYGSCGFEAQGISPGWGDTYASWLPDQWIDITEVPDGAYWLEVEVDPEHRLAEADETNNVVRVPIRLRPPEALPDRYEENDSFDDVEARVVAGVDSPNLGAIESRRTIAALSMEDEQDLFAFRLNEPAGRGGVIRIESPWNVGDLDLVLDDADRGRVAASQGATSAEQVALDGLAQGDYFVVVTSRSGTNPEYTLTIDPGGDSCPAGPGGPGEDSDRDGIADTCDNCPAIANADQADSNRDGAGDACQPGLTLASIVQDGGDRLEVRATAREPQGRPVTGRIVISGTWRRHLELYDAFAAADCGLAFLPDGRQAEGVAFTFAGAGEPYLFDIDSVMRCADGLADYQFAAGACPQSMTSFDTVLPLTGLSLPAPVCVRPVGAYTGGMTLLIESYDAQRMLGSLDTWTGHLLDVPFEGSLPKRIPLASMVSGQIYDLIIEVGNGSTPPVSARDTFLYSGERLLVVNSPPEASIAAPGGVECDRPGAGAVALDASGSSDPDSSPGTSDDLERFEWFESFGTPRERLLGTGPRLETVLPLGSHPLALRVTDSEGESDVKQALVTVRDSTPPRLTVTARPTVLWPPDHRLAPVAVTWEAEDRCDPSVHVGLESVTSSEPDDAPEAGDGATTGDVRDAETGTPDALVSLRAERSGKGAGRTYTLTYAAIDGSGNRRSAVTVVKVAPR